MPHITTSEARERIIKGKTRVFIGNANWDIYSQPDGRLWAIPKADCLGCDASPYGDKDHVRRLMNKGYFTQTPTEAGLALLSGLWMERMTNPDGSIWYWLRFAHPSDHVTAAA